MISQAESKIEKLESELEDCRGRNSAGDSRIDELEKKLKDIAMRKVVELLKKNLTKGKSEAEDVLTKEGIPEALKTEICLQFSGLQALN